MFLTKFIQLTRLKEVCFYSTNKLANLPSELKVERLEGDDSGIVVLGLNRHSASNALGHNLTNLLINSVEQLTMSEKARVVIIRSHVAGVFCAGADLKERLQMSNGQVSEMVAKLSSLASAIENIPIPTIAAIDGTALGGGLEMTLSCDLRIVSADAKVGLVETKWAIMPAAGGSQRLPRIINPSIAKELIYCARVIDGIEAKTIGLANYAVNQNSSSDAAYQKSLSIARQILFNGPIGVKAAKMAINRGLETDILTGCNIEQLCYAQVIPTKDRLEGLQAFKDKRAPNYKGE